MIPLKSNAEAMRETVLFERAIDSATGLAVYRVGSPDCWVIYAPTPTTAAACACLHRVAARNGAWEPVSDLWGGRGSRDPRKSIKEALERAAAKIEDVCPKLRAVFKRLEVVLWPDGRIMARVMRQTVGPVFEITVA
ncbi:hypothetical protein [Variovorax sp. UC74_104]|uniref:hypothetical protein n=1 Tax=Variovorax sp. UC74_104 TaxID=3374555 RepID=UPI003757E4BA